MIWSPLPCDFPGSSPDAGGPVATLWQEVAVKAPRSHPSSTVVASLAVTVEAKHRRFWQLKDLKTGDVFLFNFIICKLCGARMGKIELPDVCEGFR